MSTTHGVSREERKGNMQFQRRKGRKGHCLFFTNDRREEGGGGGGQHFLSEGGSPLRFYGRTLGRTKKKKEKGGGKKKKGMKPWR